MFSIKTTSGFFLGNFYHVAETEHSVGHNGYCTQLEFLSDASRRLSPLGRGSAGGAGQRSSQRTADLEPWPVWGLVATTEGNDKHEK